ncbi:DUF4190 domain-containing protein [Mobilicoccus massiliensis]|uniref:DUF4190 domain-containing protein n=1 Tax=Mobilicoccus massiliensis TaxID=1522310 RepID=UPI0006938836|nr:DUF4190 domain-containing protein [Mobilicoccus massiliensis]
MATSSGTHLAPPQNGLGTAGLVLGIISLVMALMPVVGVTAIPLALIGLGLSIAGLFRARAGRATNFGSAMAGLILSSLAALVGIIWMILAIVAASSLDGSSENSAGKGGDAADTAQVRSGEEAASDKEVKLGKAIVIDDFKGQGNASLTVDKVQDDVKSDNGLIKPAEGNKFVSAHVKVTNVGSTTYTNLSWYGAKVYTKQGQAYDANPMAEPAKGQALPQNIDLKPKGTVDGWILFEVPANAKVASVVFDDAEWTL